MLGKAGYDRLRYAKIAQNKNIYDKIKVNSIAMIDMIDKVDKTHDICQTDKMDNFR